jgi:hypothetical protein
LVRSALRCLSGLAHHPLRLLALHLALVALSTGAHAFALIARRTLARLAA